MLYIGQWQRADSVDEHSKRSHITHNCTERQTMKHTFRHTQKNLHLVLATVPWCHCHLGHCSLFHVFWAKVGGASPIGYISIQPIWRRRPVTDSLLLLNHLWVYPSSQSSVRQCLCRAWVIVLLKSPCSVVGLCSTAIVTTIYCRVVAAIAVNH